jgi:collagen beta-1,O-galactosyltransferase
MVQSQGMLRYVLSLVAAYLMMLIALHPVAATGEGVDWLSDPTVMVAVLIRNKAHTLPWFLYYLENLEYPKQRMRLWIRSDHNEDNSTLIVNEWLLHVRNEYNDVDFKDDASESSYSDASGPLDWSPKHFQHVIHLRQQALDVARKSWADFFLFGMLIIC